MGSGKSTVAKLLAESLHFQILDTDESIVKLTGKPISDIFQNEGEKHFRAKEQEILNLATTLDKLVISSGGGLPIYNSNMIQIVNAGLTIYLKCDPDVLADRIFNDQSTRPLHSKANNLEKLIQEVKERLTTRSKIYEEAHLIIDGNQTPEVIKNEILAKMRGEY